MHQTPILIAILIVFVLCCYFTRTLAIKKNRDPAVWLFASIALGPIALLLILILPTKR